VLVTGAAGSIGSELCRQAAALEPRLLVAFDQAESNLFRLDQELRARFPDLCVIPWIGDIRDAARVRELMSRHRFAAVFHVAAYKHVPMMEAHPLELIRTNVLGTWNVLRAATEHGASRFALVSTDKAVQPASVMGLTKRVAELLVESRAGGSRERTRLAIVRFGNVLGSNGSVVPLFEEQIDRGGPVTVTHPDIERYFLTIREAAQFVLQAAAMTRGCETFLPDMGEPIRIADLARSLIERRGLVPGKDVEIRYIGLRPGEKLVEDLVGRDEKALVTSHPRVHVLRRPRVDPGRIDTWIRNLAPILESRNNAAAVAYMAELVPEYQPGGDRAGMGSGGGTDCGRVEAIEPQEPSCCAVVGG
jgi:FlaA1/EpsC-like NDP-sugar epimerase